MKTNQESEPRKPCLGVDEITRRELLSHLVDFIHRCSELEIDFEKLSDLAISIQVIEINGTPDDE